MKTRWWLASGSAVVFVVLLTVWKSAGQTADRTDPPSKIDPLNASDGSALHQGTPRAWISTTEYDFNVMNPDEDGVHTFVIRNDGDAVLRLAPGPRTCRCTSCEISKKELAPGESGEVHLHWNTLYSTAEYRQGATIKTNDPNRRKIRLRAFGQVRTLFGASPQRLIFSDLTPGQEATRRTVIFSQYWKQFEITDVTTSMPGLRWMIEPADPDDLIQNDALCGCQLTVTVPGDLGRGGFGGWIRFKLKTEEGDDEGEEDKTYELTFDGNVAKRLSIYGPKIDRQGTLNFGVVHPGTDISTRLLLRLRDPQSEIHLTQVSAEPSYIHVALSPFQSAKKRDGLYYLDVKIPADQAFGNHLGPDAGTIDLTFDHPRVEQVTLRVEFAVLAASAAR